MKQVEFEVIGMHCVSCSMGIRKLVQKLKTVDQADVELGTSKLFVTYKEDNPDPKGVVDAVARLGYRAIPKL